MFARNRYPVDIVDTLPAAGRDGNDDTACQADWYSGMPHPVCYYKTA